MPFVSILVGNYLFPVYLSQTLHASATVLGLSFTSYAVGAVLAGVTIPFLTSRLRHYRTVVLTVAVFTAGMLAIAWIPVAWVYILLEFVLGWGNAGTRVARNTIMMETVPNPMIGRVDAFFNTIGLGIRVSLIALFTQSIPRVGVPISLSVIGVLLLLSCAGLLASRRLFPSSDAAGKRLAS